MVICYNDKMKIKKIGHCCLFIQTEKINILTDPGVFSSAQNEIKNIDVVLITHEHKDHLHIESLKTVLQNNEEVKVITNVAVGKILDEENIPYEVLDDKVAKDVKGVLIQAFDCKHEEIFEEVGRVQNTGFFIDNKLFYPGDSFCVPDKAVDILALPVAGPWCKVADAIKFALKVKPNKAFPVHDGALQADKMGGNHAMPAKVLSERGIDFVVMREGDEVNFRA